MDFRTINGCPVGKLIAPYIQIITADAGADVSSIYRGDDARAILNAHGKHSQRQLFDATPAERIAWEILGTPDRPGTSSHEMRSDGVPYPKVPVGHKLPHWWMQGFDVDTAHSSAVIRQAKRHGWDVFRPYPSGAEIHHLNFRSRPRPGPRTARRIIELRRHLPHH